MPLVLTCPNCGGTFVRMPSQIRKGKLHFCSRSCRTSYYNKQNNPAWKIKGKTLVTLKCAYCGKEFKRPAWWSKGKNVFCSVSCVNRFYRHRSKWRKMSKDEVRQLLEIYRQCKNIREFQEKVGSKCWESVRPLFLRYFPEEYLKIREEHKIKTNIIYAIGRKFEKKIRQIFEAKGYFVYESPLSRSPADMVAIKEGEILLIQAKFNSNYIKQKELEKLKTISQSINAKPILALHKGQGAVEIQELK
jgi:hypothetical protein